MQNRTLNQIKRKGRIALYELCGANGMLYGFEVVIVKISPARTVFGKDYPEREVYPSNEDWGATAWSYGRDWRDLAEECYKRLCRLEHRGVDDLNDLEASEGQDSGPGAITER